MHPKLDILLSWDIDALDYYFEKGIVKYISEYNDANDEMNLPKLSDKQLAFSAFQFFRQSILYELNALIEHYLQIASAGDEPILLSNSLLKRGRSESIKTIYERYNIDITNLTGYSDIKKLYSMVNALKHRGGFQPTDFSKVIPQFKHVSIDFDSLKELKESSFSFIRSLVNAILIIEGK